MEDNKNKKKIKEGRNLIIIPLLISVICAWLDIWTKIASNAFSNYRWTECITDIIRCAIGYLFPSLLSLVIAMVWQQVTMEEDIPYGVEPRKIRVAIIWTVIYSAGFISCLIMYNIQTAIVLLFLTVGYVIWFYRVCLDERLKRKNDMSEDEMLQVYLKKNNQRRRK